MGKQMKYKYEFKNKALGEAVYTIFGEEFARDEIEQQMPDFDDFIRIEVDEWDANNKLFNSHVEFSKTEIEKKLIYDPEGWNPHPEIEPPESGDYLVTLQNGDLAIVYYVAATYGPSASDCQSGHWYVSNPVYSEAIIAFRELPEKYDPEKSE